MKYKSFKMMSKEDMRKVLGGRAPLASECSMRCANGKNISISDCNGDCGCSESLQGCACVYNGSTQCSSLCQTA